MGRELPPADVLAADQRITWWAKQLRAAGLDGDMDQLRARAYLDILLNKDSRPSARPERAAGSATGDVDGEPGSRPEGEDGGRADSSDGEEPGGPGHGGSAPSDPDEPGIPPTAGVPPAGLAGRLHLTVPLTTLLNLAERPGEIPGLGPVDPALARDLAKSAGANTLPGLVIGSQACCERPSPSFRDSMIGAYVLAGQRTDWGV